MRRLLAAAIALALLSAVAPAAGAVEARTTLPDVEDEVMCIECGTTLSLSKAPVAEREREFIRREIARGRTKEQIKDSLVARFGPNVLAEPDDEGFGLAAYLVPIALALLALVVVVLAARRWRRETPDTQQPDPTLDAADAERLDRDLGAFDR